MDRETRERIQIYNEKGIVRKIGASFHSPQEFAVEHLFYAAWSNRYLCNSLYEVKREYLDFYSVIYVLDGKMEVSYQGQDILVEENEAILLDFKKPHAYRTKGDHLDKWEMVFRGNASEAFYTAITEKWGYTFKAAGKLKGVLESLMSELNSSFPRDHMISMLIHSMFCEIMEQNAAQFSPPIEKALAYMYSHYDRPLQIGEVAAHAALSRHYFSRRFLQETGRTPNEYLAEIRINSAKELLAEKLLPVAEVAEECGFVNASHFTRFFREKTGQTPAAFRSVFYQKNEQA